MNIDQLWSQIEPRVLGMIAPRAASLGAALRDVPNLQAAWIPQRAFSGSGSTAIQPDMCAGHDLTLNNAPTIGLEQVGKIYEAGYWSLASASSMYLSRASETAFNLTTALTFGLWVKPTTLTTCGLIGKGIDMSGNRAWLLVMSSTGVPFVYVYDSGGTLYNIGTGLKTVFAGAWHFVQAKFSASSELSIFVNGQKFIKSTGLPAAVRTTAGPFGIGAYDGGYFNGLVGAGYVSASALGDKTIMGIFNKTRGFYGV